MKSSQINIPVHFYLKVDTIMLCYLIIKNLIIENLEESCNELLKTPVVKKCGAILFFRKFSNVESVNNEG